MKRFGIWLMVALVSFAFSNARGVTSAEEVDYAKIVNLAGMQRMLTQKMSKEILLIAWNINVDKNREELRKSADTFERTLDGLIHGDEELGLAPTVNQDIVKQLDKVKSFWNDFRVVVNEIVTSGKASKDIIEKISELNLLLLVECDIAVMMYEVEAEYLTGGDAFTINEAGRQRMLTQKMIKEFLLATLNVNADENKLRAMRTAGLFEQTLNGLVEGNRLLKLHPTTNKAIIQQLSNVRTLWKDFKEPFYTAVGAGKWSQDSIRKIADLNLPVLGEMDKAVWMYEDEYRPDLATKREVWFAY